MHLAHLVLSTTILMHGAINLSKTVGRIIVSKGGLFLEVYTTQPWSQSLFLLCSCYSVSGDKLHLAAVKLCAQSSWVMMRECYEGSF
jgi:hypothetical protein